MAAKINIATITTGSDADFKRAFVWMIAGGSAIDLTGSSLLMQVRRAAGDAQVLVEASTDNGLIVITNAIGGAFTLRLPYSFLKSLPDGTYAHSLVRKVIATGFRDQLWTGTMIHKVQAARDNLA